MSRDNDPNVHRRRSVRLPWYDYSEEGWYFVTICTQSHYCLFGRITENRMNLNIAGAMLKMWWYELENKFPLVRTDAYVVMPNHFHGIIYVGAALCGRPGVENGCGRLGRPHRVAPTGDVEDWLNEDDHGTVS